MANEFIARNGIIALADSSISGSLTVSGGITGSFSGSIIGSASYATISDSSSYALSSSYAATASYALNAGAGGISSISIADEGTFQGTASYFNFIGAGVTTAVSANTASFTITGGSGGGTTVLGGTATLTQSLAATTWSFAHNLGLVYPVVTVYDGISVIQPLNITPTDANNLKIYFSSPKSGYAVAVAGGGYYVTNAGTTRVLTVTTASSTWTFQHNIGDQYPAFEIYDASNNVLIPSNIQAVDINTATITFAYPATGKAVATLGGGSGYGTVITTTSASSTWSLTHNLRENYPIVTIWESGSNQIVQPDTITSVDQNTVLVTFTVPVKGYANISRAGSIISGSTDWNLLINKPNVGVVYSQSLASATWNIPHNLGTQYPLVTVYDSSNAVVLPQSIVGVDSNNITITFPSAQTGFANLSRAGNYISGSILWQNITNNPFSTTGSVTTMSGSLIITGSLTVSGSGTFNNVGPANFTGSTYFSGSVYHTGSLVRSGSTTISGSLLMAGDISGSNALFTGNIIAQTLVVQTITSSISSITGSTKFGSLSTNTHQFTGSMFVSGSISSDLTDGGVIFTKSVGANTGLITSTNQITGAGSKIDLNAYVYGGEPFGVWTNNTKRLTIDGSGAATFSSSVNGSSITAITNDTNYLTLQSTKGGQTIGLRTISTTKSYFCGSNYSVADNFEIYDLTASASRLAITSGGNVGIGTSNPNAVLHVGTATSGNQKLQQWGEPGFVNTYGLILRGSSLDGIFKFYGLTNGTETSAPILSMNRGNGNVLIGSATDYNKKLQVSGELVSINSVIGAYSTTSSTNYGFFNNGVGSLLLTNAGIANVGTYDMSTGVYVATSDVNKKKDFEASTIGLKEVLELNPTLYRMKLDETNGNKELGFIAQEVKEFIPQAFVETGGFIGLNYNAIVAALVKSVQEQQAQIEAQQAEIEELKNK